jgi:hypothetical protein
LQVWHDPRPRNYVLALEPSTSARPEPGRSGDDAYLAPGELRTYAIDLDFNSLPPGAPR